MLRALEKEPEQRYQHASEVKTDVEQISSTERPSAPPAAPAVEARSGRHRSLRPAVPLLITLAVWTGVLVGAGLYLASMVWDDWWPTIYKEQFEIGLEPQSGAYRNVTLRAERRLFCWGQHEDRPIAKKAWIATATIDLPEPKTTATLEFDSFVELWRWAPPVGQATATHDELRPEFVAHWMEAAGIDISKPGVQEEAAELIRLLKDAANGIAPGGRGPRAAGSTSGTQIGPFTSDGSSSWGIFWEGSVVVFRLIAAAMLLTLWTPPVLIMLRRYRRRLAAAREKEPERRDQLVSDTKTDVGPVAARGASFAPGQAPPAEAAEISIRDTVRPSTPRFSRKAICGAAWATFFFVAILPSVIVKRDVNERSSSVAYERSQSQGTAEHDAAPPARSPVVAMGADLHAAATGCNGPVWHHNSGRRVAERDPPLPWATDRSAAGLGRHTVVPTAAAGRSDLSDLLLFCRHPSVSR